jgi:hypothetical protein
MFAVAQSKEELKVTDAGFLRGLAAQRESMPGTQFDEEDVYPPARGASKPPQHLNDLFSRARLHRPTKVARFVSKFFGLDTWEAERNEHFNESRMCARSKDLAGVEEDTGAAGSSAAPRGGDTTFSSHALIVGSDGLVAPSDATLLRQASSVVAGALLDTGLLIIHKRDQKAKTIQPPLADAGECAKPIGSSASAKVLEQALKMLSPAAGAAADRAAAPARPIDRAGKWAALPRMVQMQLERIYARDPLPGTPVYNRVPERVLDEHHKVAARPQAPAAGVDALQYVAGPRVQAVVSAMDAIKSTTFLRDLRSVRVSSGAMASKMKGDADDKERLMNARTWFRAHSDLQKAEAGAGTRVQAPEMRRMALELLASSSTLVLEPKESQAARAPRRFLNHMLDFPIELQSVVFAYFNAILDKEVLELKASGNLDAGIVSLHADNATNKSYQLVKSIPIDQTTVLSDGISPALEGADKGLGLQPTAYRVYEIDRGFDWDSAIDLLIETHPFSVQAELLARAQLGYGKAESGKAVGVAFDEGMGGGAAAEESDGAVDEIDDADDDEEDDTLGGFIVNDDDEEDDAEATQDVNDSDSGDVKAPRARKRLRKAKAGATDPGAVAPKASKKAAKKPAVAKKAGFKQQVQTILMAGVHDAAEPSLEEPPEGADDKDLEPEQLVLRLKKIRENVVKTLFGSGPGGTAARQLSESGFYLPGVRSEDRLSAYDASVILVIPESALENRGKPAVPIEDAAALVAGAVATSAATAAAPRSLSNLLGVATGPRKMTRLAVFRPDGGRLFMSSDRALFAETIRGKYSRFYNPILARQAWVTRHHDSMEDCKHAGGCTRPDSCTLGRRMTKFCVITGTLLPIWQRLQKALTARWSESETVQKAQEALRKRLNAAPDVARKDPYKSLPKPPLRVIHLVVDDKPMLGLSLPHGVADLTIDTLLKKIPLHSAKQVAESAAASSSAPGASSSAAAASGPYLATSSKALKAQKLALKAQREVEYLARVRKETEARLLQAQRADEAAKATILAERAKVALMQAAARAAQAAQAASSISHNPAASISMLDARAPGKAFRA